MIYEMRTYRAAPGKIDALHRRFADHTIGLFAKHNMGVVGFWTPDGDPETLVYLMRFDSRDAMKAAWTAFAADPAKFSRQAKSTESRRRHQNKSGSQPIFAGCLCTMPAWCQATMSCFVPQ